MLVPTMVRTFGRTGSTLLMQILGTSPRVCFERTYPFEHRYLTWAYNMSRVAGAPCQGDERWNNDLLFQSGSPIVGGLPYGDIGLFDREAFGQALFRVTWQAMSEAIRARAGIDPGTRAFYAEKVPRQVAAMADEHLGGRHIWLLRDPRDEMVSIRSFNAKRGFLSFGWQEADTDESYARRLCRNRREFLQRMIAMRTTDKEISVRYEDLVLEPRREIGRLSDWLGEPLKGLSAFKGREIRKQHMTAPDAKGSVARWRDELDGDVQSIFRDEIGGELEQLGYAA